MSPLESPQLNPLPLRIAPAARQSRYWLKRQATLTLTVILGLAGGMMIAQTIVPPAVHAYTGTVNVTIDVQPSETYDTLVRRAEAIARAATQRSFDRDILITDVSIVVIAQSASATVPVLSLTTTRPQWRSQPDPRRWATYYSTSKALLGLSNSPSSTIVQPTVTTVTPQQSQPRSTSPNVPNKTSSPTAPASSGGTTGSSQTPTTAPSSILPKRIPSPVGK